jgi:glycosyltransferase involved in cell wall biosynthesis
MKPSISAFFPAYNDAGTIPSMVIAADMTLRSVADDYEIIVVNDGSSDHTAEVLEELKRSYPRLRVVHHEKNRGYGGALRTGFASACKDLIFYTDGDAQYDPREMVLLLKAMTADVDVVNGYKVKRSDPLHRVVIGKLYHWTVKTAFGLKVRDTDCDFRLFRRQVFDKVKLERNSGVICVEMMKKVQDAGFTIAQVPVSHYHRAYGHSQFFNFARVFRVGVDLIRLWRELVLSRSLDRGRAEARAIVQEEQ